MKSSFVFLCLSVFLSIFSCPPALRHSRCLSFLSLSPQKNRNEFLPARTLSGSLLSLPAHTLSTSLLPLHTFMSSASLSPFALLRSWAWNSPTFIFLQTFTRPHDSSLVNTFSSWFTRRLEYRVQTSPASIRHPHTSPLFKANTYLRYNPSLYHQIKLLLLHDAINPPIFRGANSLICSYLSRIINHLPRIPHPHQFLWGFNTLDSAPYEKPTHQPWTQLRIQVWTQP